MIHFKFAGLKNKNNKTESWDLHFASKQVFYSKWLCRCIRKWLRTIYSKVSCFIDKIDRGSQSGVKCHQLHQKRSKGISIHLDTIFQTRGPWGPGITHLRMGYLRLNSFSANGNIIKINFLTKFQAAQVRNAISIVLTRLF